MVDAVLSLAAGGVLEATDALSFAAAMTCTMRVAEPARPLGSVTM